MGDKHFNPFFILQLTASPIAFSLPVLLLKLPLSVLHYRKTVARENSVKQKTHKKEGGLFSWTRAQLPYSSPCLSSFRYGEKSAEGETNQDRKSVEGRAVVKDEGVTSLFLPTST